MQTCVPLNRSLCVSVSCSVALILEHGNSCYLLRCVLACTHPAMMRGNGQGRGRTEGRRGVRWECERICLPSERGAQSRLLLMQGDSKCKWMNTNDCRDEEERLRGREGRTGRSG